MMLHHLQTLVVIISTLIRLLILRLTRSTHRHLPWTMGSANCDKVLTSCLHKVRLRIIEPAVDKIAVEAVSVSNLLPQS
jgi:hypothetical protein